MTLLDRFYIFKNALPEEDFWNSLSKYSKSSFTFNHLGKVYGDCDILFEKIYWECYSQVITTPGIDYYFNVDYYILMQITNLIERYIKNKVFL